MTGFYMIENLAISEASPKGKIVDFIVIPRHKEGHSGFINYFQH